MAAAQYYEEVQQAYLAYYGRPADPAGQAYWANQLNNAGGNLNSIINAFGTSAESTALYGGSNTAAQISAIYETLFGRQPDVAGLNFYVNGIATGQFTLASVALNVYYGATGTDATALTAKLAYADAFTTALEASASAQIAYTGTAASNNARAAVATVVDTVSEAAAAANLSTMLTNIGSGTVGQTVSLTTGVDNITLTGNNNVVNAVMGTDGNTHTVATLNAFDSIKGAANSTGNTLNIADSNPQTADLNTGLPTGATVSNVQNINILTSGDVGIVTANATVNGFAEAPAVFDATGITGLTNLNVQSAGSNGDSIKASATTNVTDTVADGGATVVGGNNVTVNANAADTFDGNISVTKAAGAVTVVDHSTGTDTITVQGGTTVSVTATAASADAINIGLAGVLNAGNTALTSTSAATEATGNITVNESTTTKGVTAFGTGAATIFTNGATSVSVTGTAGDAITDVQTTTNGAVSFGTSTLASVTLDGVTGVTNGTTSNVIVSDALTSLTILDDDNVVTGGSTASFTVVNTNAHALALTVGANLVTGDSSTALLTPTTEYANVTDATATGVTVATTGTVAADVTLAVAAATSLTFDNSAKVTLEASTLTKLTTITAEGSGALNLLDLSGSTTITSIDASHATGGVTVTLNSNEAFQGGAGNDVVTISAAPAGTLDGGAGTNEIIVNGAAFDLSGVTNFQVLGLENSTGAYTASGFSSFALEGATAAATTISAIKATAATFTDHATSDAVLGDLTLSFASNNDALTVNLGADSASSASNVSLDLTTATTAKLAAGALGGGVSTLDINSAGLTVAQEAAQVAASHAAWVAGGSLGVDPSIALAATLATTANTLNLTDANLQSVTIHGDSAIHLISDATVSSIDASAATGYVDVTGVSLADGATVKGGAGQLAASITAGDATVSIGTGGAAIAIGAGAGNDAITIASGATGVTTLTYADGASVNTGTTTATFNGDVVTGFVNFATAAHGGAGLMSDTLAFGTAGITLAGTSGTAAGVAYTLSNGVLGFSTGVSFAKALSTAEALVFTDATTGTHAGSTAAFAYGGNTYVVHAAGTEANAAHDAVVELVGVTGLTSVGGTVGAHNLAITAIA